MKNVTYKIIAVILIFVMTFNFGSVSLAEVLKITKEEDTNEQLIERNTEKLAEEIEIEDKTKKVGS